MTDQPNILVLLTDQQRPDSIGAYGQALPTTPVLDELAADGAIFESAFTIQPICGPARASLQTGMLPTDLGCWRNALALPPDVPTMATRLGDLGYQTGYVGKWHLASDAGLKLPAGRTKANFARRPVPPERRGGYKDAWAAADALEMTSGPTQGHVFDEDGNEVNLKGFRTDGLTDVAIDRMNRMSRDDRPFLLFVSHLEPHHQNNRFRTIAPEGTAFRFKNFEVPGDLRRTLGDWRWNYASTLACAEAIDRSLGRLIEALRLNRRDDNTLIIFSSDHGSHFRTRNLEYKRSPHDASIRIPLVVHGPGFRGGVRSDRLVTHLDVVPTMVEAAGGTTDGLPGRPLQEALDDAPGAVPWREEVFIQISESQIGRALRTPTHTFAATAPGLDRLRGHIQPAANEYRASHLYDLVADPFQRRNLVKEPDMQGLCSEFADRLADAIERAEGRRPLISLR